MEVSPVRTATRADESAVIATIVMAFSSDPAARWTYPDPHDYLMHFPNFVRAFGGKAFANNTAHIAQDGAGAALWLPPNVSPDEEELGAVLEHTTSDTVRDDVSALFEHMGRYHPKEPHWYLPLLGVDGPKRGRGHGSALLRCALETCDRDGTPAYLESSNARNIPLYQRHGFELLGTIQAGHSPEIYPMLR